VLCLGEILFLLKNIVKKQCVEVKRLDLAGISSNAEETTEDSRIDYCHREREIHTKMYEYTFHDSA